MKKTRLSMKRASRLLAAAALAVISGSSALAQISVGDSGVGPLTFGALPTPADGWSTLDAPGGAGDITDTATMDARVMTNDASVINLPLGQSGTQPPSENAVARWNSAGFYLQTRPTSRAYNLLMGTFQNDGTADRSTVILSYDFAQRNPIPVSESIPGHRVFYSLTGAPGSWTLIPEISTYTTNDTTIAQSVTLTLPSPWAVGQKLYVLWADDNGPGGTTNPQEGANTIDNVAISFAVNPTFIATGPVGQTNSEYSVVSLNVGAGGTGPFTFQWSKNGTPIGGATASTLVITNTAGSGHTWSRPEDSGNYSVTVTGASGSATTNAQVLIRPDTNAPTVLWAVADTNRVRVMLSEPLINSLDDYGNISANLYWSVVKVSGPGDDIGAPDVDIQLVGNEVQLVYSALSFDPGTTYKVTYEGATLSDRAQTANTSTQLESPLYIHENLILPMNQVWKYSDKDVAAPANWFTTSFDDSDGAFWSSGPGVFDAKRQTTQPWCRAVPVNSITNAVGTCIVLSNANATAHIPTYYFRTHFNFAGNPADTALRMFGEFDDGAIVYLNGVEIWRVGLPTGTFPHNQFVSGIRTVGDGDAPDRGVLLPGSALVTGDNVLAVELRQVNATSSDITMALEVTAASAGPAVTPPHLTISRNGNQISVQWTPAGGSLLEATSVTGPWTTNGNANPTLVNPTGSQKFFRVVQ